MGFSELPQEVHDLIVDFAAPEGGVPEGGFREGGYVWEDITMPTSALVSRSLTARAQWHIFRNVKLIGAKDFSMFESTLASSPRLGAYTATLVVALGDTRWQRHDELPGSKRKLGTLARILRGCSNMGTLHAFVDETITPLDMAALGSTRNLPALRHIHLAGVFGGGGGLAYSVFEAFCSLAQRLDVLQLSSMKLTIDKSGPRNLALPEIRHLEMTLEADERSFIHLTKMLEGYLGKLVVNLSKSCAFYREIWLVSAVGYTLRSLTITRLTDGKLYL